MYEVPFEVKQALKKGIYKKNYRFNILNDDETVDFTIDNDTLVKESVKFDERMASGNELKFGLCEGTSLEFRYFNHDNINGRRLQAFIDVEYVESNNSKQWHTIPMGFFTVDSCPMQFSTGIRKVTAYNKLMSNYLDAKANDLITTLSEKGETDVSLFYITNNLLEGFSIEGENQPNEQPMYGEANTNVVWDSSPIVDPPFYEKIAFHITEDISDGSNVTTIDHGYCLIQRKVIMTGLRTEAQAHSSATNVLPIGYHKIEFNSNISQELENGFNETLGKYQDYEGHTYYVQPIYTNDTAWVGDKYKISDLLKSTNELMQPSVSVSTDYNTSYSHMDSCFKGLVALDRDTMGAASKYPYLRIKGATQYSENDFNFYQFITPTNAKQFDYVYVDTDISADYHSCNCATLVLPSAYYWTDDIENFDDATSITIESMREYEYPWFEDNVYDFNVQIKTKILNKMESQRLSEEQIENLPDVTLRELQSAIFETVCQYGQLDRETDLFSGVELNDGGLYPAETLYPATGLYPNASYSKSNFHPFPSEYEKLWTDTVGAQTFKYLIITYKTTITDSSGNIQEVEKTLQRTVNTNGTTNYNMSDNWLFKNLIWTADQVGEYADAMVEKMRGITWFPFEMWAAGLPYVETGDMIEITDKAGDTYTSYVLQRQLNGIHNLKDTYINGELDIF